MIGQTIAHYKITAKLGVGGMGEVYRATDIKLGRDVALKVLPPNTFADETARARLLSEARSAAALNHPHICTIHEVGDVGGQAYIAMELVEGQPLSACLAAGPLPHNIALRYGAQIADALAHAHERQIIHRDLKSRNVVITPDGRVKLLDFGLAKRLAEGELGQVTRSNVSLTQPGTVVGTLHYMAPEVLRGGDASAASDLWALGIVLHEMISGTHPFRGQSGFETSSAILRDPPAPLPMSVPAGLRAVILRCLEKDPGHRYSQASEVRAALEILDSGVMVPEQRAVLDHKWKGWGLGGATALVLLAFVMGVGPTIWQKLRPGQADAHRIQSLAVLPLANMAGDSSQEYIVDGMTESLITQLSKISALRVVSRTSVMQYKGTKKPLREIAQELGVDAIVEGSVLRSGEQVRVTAQLIHAATDTHIWAESYDRPLSDVLAMHSEVARKIAAEIRLTVSPEEHARLTSAPSTNAAANEAYFLGRHQLRKLSAEGAQAAIEHFEKAIQLDAKHALAYSGLAEAFTNINNVLVAPTEAMPRAKAAAQRAIELDPNLADGFATLGNVRFFYEWDWTAAEQDFKRALALNANSAVAHLDYGSYLIALGRQREGLEETRRAYALDPLSASIRGLGIWNFLMARQYDEALQYAQKAVEMEPQFAVGHVLLGFAYAQLGRREQALAAVEKARQLSSIPRVLALQGWVHATLGDRAKGEKAAAELALAAKRRYVCGYTEGTVYVALGKKEQAFQGIERSFLQRSD